MVEPVRQRERNGRPHSGVQSDDADVLRIHRRCADSAALWARRRLSTRRDDGWTEALAAFPKLAGSRQVFTMTIDGVQTSCGFGVPVMTFESDRLEEELTPVFAKMGPEGVRNYWQRRNAETIDGFATGIAED